MKRFPWVVLAVLLLSKATPLLVAQHTGGMMGGMMSMPHDSATKAQMTLIHELMMNHQRITRTVTNLPDGILTITESSDTLLARRIREHVATMDRRVAAGDDPGLPMESPALHAIFLHNAKVHTVVSQTGMGVVVVQTSSDSATVAALQRHAAEVSDLVQGGMAAMHAAMMRRGMGMGMGMGGHKMPR